MSVTEHLPAVAVTAFFDLSDHGAVPRRSKNEYLHLGQDVLSLQMPMVIFCDHELVDYMYEQRRQLCPDQKTFVCADDISSRWASEREVVDHLLSTSRPASLGNHIKDTTDYTFIGWSKWHWLAEASELISGGSFWWIDFGLTHVAKRTNGVEEACSHAWPPNSHHDVVVLSLARDDTFIDSNIFQSYLRSSVDGNMEWLHGGVPTVAGGLFGVRGTHVHNWVQGMEYLRKDALSRNILCSEQMLLSWSAAANPEQARLIPSRYEDLLQDFVHETPLQITQLDGDIRLHLLPNSCGAGWSAMNPSIAGDDDGQYRAVIRHVNYQYVDGNYVTLDDSNVIRTRNVLVNLDADFTITSTREINDSVCTGTPVFPVHGLEDVRLFCVNDQWMISATMRQHRSDGLCEIVYGQLDDNIVTSSAIIPSPLPGRHEKNWMPVHQHFRSEWIWNVQPVVRVIVDEITNSYLTHPPVSRVIPTNLRGGSQVMPWRDGWLCVVHDVVWHPTTSGDRREYRHFFAYMSRDWTTVTVSRPFLFGHSGIEFCAGIAQTHGGVVMSYGLEDREAYLMVIPHSVVDDLLSVAHCATS